MIVAGTGALEAGTSLFFVFCHEFAGSLERWEAQFVHWYYVFVSGAMILFDVDVTDDAIVDRHAQTMANLLLNEFPQ